MRVLSGVRVQQLNENTHLQVHPVVGQRHPLLHLQKKSANAKVYEKNCLWKTKCVPLRTHRCQKRLVEKSAKNNTIRVHIWKKNVPFDSQKPFFTNSMCRRMRSAHQQVMNSNSKAAKKSVCYQTELNYKELRAHRNAYGNTLLPFLSPKIFKRCCVKWQIRVTTLAQTQFLWRKEKWQTEKGMNSSAEWPCSGIDCVIYL